MRTYGGQREDTWLTLVVGTDQPDTELRLKLRLHLTGRKILREADLELTWRLR